MPQVIAVAATAVTYIGQVVAGLGNLAVAAISAQTGLSVATVAAAGTFAVNIALSAATTALMTPTIGRGGSPTAFKADPNAPISGVMGRFGVGGRQLHANVWGGGNLYLSFAVALSLGPVQSIESFTANGTAVTFPNAQGLAATVEPYRDKMWQTNRLGLPTDAYLGPPTGVSDASPAMSEWTSAHTLPGFAQVFWTMRNNSKRAGYQGGVPAPLWTLLGMKVWDPRLDSTYPGGSGSQRRTDWTTWTYSANPYLHALAWVRGHHKLVSGGTIDLTKRLAGVGAPDAAIDIAAFVDGANVADANGWEISGEWTTADDKWQTLSAMLQAGGGVPISQGAQISCMVETPRTSLMTVTGADIVGSVSLNVMASRRDRPNTVIPRVRLEAHRFAEVALGAVTSSTYLAEDGGESRVTETAYRFVGAAKQGAELAGYGLANTRETLKASIPCKPYLLGLRAGDALTVTEPELGLSAQKFVVMRRSFDPASGVVTLDVRSETDAKHAWALGRSADAPSSPSLSAPDPVPAAPVSGDWSATALPVEPSGAQQPGLIVTGPTVGDNIGAVLVEYSTSSSGPWTQAYSGPPTISSVEINGLIGGDDYYVGVTYSSVRGVPSEQLVKGPYAPLESVALAVVDQGALATRDTVDGDDMVFGPNTVLSTATDTLQTTFDDKRRVLALGAGLGPSADIWEWEGPSATAIASVTTANGDYVRTKSGLLYRKGVLQRVTRFDRLSASATKVYMPNLLWEVDDGDPETIQSLRPDAIVATFMLPFAPGANDLLSVGLNISSGATTKWFNVPPSRPNSDLRGLYEIAAYSGTTIRRLVLSGTWQADATGYNSSVLSNAVRSVGIDRTHNEVTVDNVSLQDSAPQGRSFTAGDADRLVLRMSAIVGSRDSFTLLPASYLENLTVGVNISTIFDAS